MNINSPQKNIAMKKLTMLLFAAIACTSIATAQDTTKTKDKMHHMGSMKSMKDCVMMKDGKMMVMKGGETTAMDQEMTMTNGTVVGTDGSVKMKDGTSRQLKDGDCVYMDGKVKSGMKKDPMTKKPM
jgi:hypothetical protein